LSTSIQQLGLFWDPSRQESIAEQALHQFFIKLLYEPDDGTKSWEAAGRQALQDLKFLGKLADLWGIGWAKMSGLVNKRAAQVQKKVISCLLYILMLNPLYFSFYPKMPSRKRSA
jgi:hypothetical protein